MIGLDGGGDGEPLDRRQATNAARRNLKIAKTSQGTKNSNRNSYANKCIAYRAERRIIMTQETESLDTSRSSPIKARRAEPDIPRRIGVCDWVERAPGTHHMMDQMQKRRAHRWAPYTCSQQMRLACKNDEILRNGSVSDQLERASDTRIVSIRWFPNR